jgi:2-polyprenyl-3-methyl-5-hydroxy-6-metoxy-1,4-benzoquinol methylase
VGLRGKSTSDALDRTTEERTGVADSVAIGGAVAAFPRERLLRLAELEDWHFWFVSRRLLVERLLDRHLGAGKRTLLDLGCGTGSLVRRLAALGHCAIGVDARPEGLESASASSPGARFIRASADRLPLSDGAFDGILLLDILEHVDDGRLIAEARRVLRPNGLLIASVPAMPWLWSYRDVAAGHLRRYTWTTITKLLEGAGFTLRETRNFQCLLFPLVAAARVAGRKGVRARDLEERPNRLINSAFAWLNRLEVRLGDRIPWPWGSSLVAVGVKS